MKALVIFIAFFVSIDSFSQDSTRVKAEYIDNTSANIRTPVGITIQDVRIHYFNNSEAYNNIRMDGYIYRVHDDGFIYFEKELVGYEIQSTYPDNLYSYEGIRDRTESLKWIYEEQGFQLYYLPKWYNHPVNFEDECGMTFMSEEQVIVIKPSSKGKRNSKRYPTITVYVKEYYLNNVNYPPTPKAMGWDSEVNTPRNRGSSF